MTTASGAVPIWNSNGLLPSYIGNPAANSMRSPYRCSLAELVSQFGFTVARRRILSGFLDFRDALHQAGVLQGLQWVNGSFVEDVMQRRRREPGDIDVVTFYYLPSGHTQETLRNAFPDLFTPGRAKQLYHSDAHFMEPNTYSMPDLVRHIAYWTNLWGHTRETYEWKGYLQIDLANSQDATARNILANAN